MTHRVYIRLTGLLWFIMGAWLMYKGLMFITYGIFKANSCAFILGSTQNSIAFLITAGLFGGYMKGKYVLSKSAARVSARILALELPVPFWKLYAPSYWLLIGSMMALGMLLNVLPVPLDIRGAIDLAIGAALIRGSFSYL